MPEQSDLASGPPALHSASLMEGWRAREELMEGHGRSWKLMEVLRAREELSPPHRRVPRRVEVDQLVALSPSGSTANRHSSPPLERPTDVRVYVTHVGADVGVAGLAAARSLPNQHATAATTEAKPLAIGDIEPQHRHCQPDVDGRGVRGAKQEPTRCKLLLDALEGCV
eukprot:CAMPEP_0181202004 /NCGR_PEP_ID=MMETSP1096-20121128/18609_1 /TAXON_ID=156174 ORGANISM="Chrysochromulina ericina, Strain CCMP281" /NCGR_SAMPLE_ID=MMETSP1096 /ASSEMBLY_ACC=CAM_ASM_000453 /LENGTH=168 /DNA_ID=CAMNT_0023292485 /DNA_START=334 /DNA_END=841 /DNA_ORIENTATION=+